MEQDLHGLKDKITLITLLTLKDKLLHEGNLDAIQRALSLLDSQCSGNGDAKTRVLTSASRAKRSFEAFLFLRQLSGKSLVDTLQGVPAVLDVLSADTIADEVKKAQERDSTWALISSCREHDHEALHIDQQTQGSLKQLADTADDVVESLPRNSSCTLHER